MSNFRAKMEAQSKKLVERFSLPFDKLPFTHLNHTDKMSAGWCQLVP